ncbi:MAG: hypothetical protein J2P27_05770 [Actinobacteria bacterium]|nr:hypothetical protein [Actinomycetota bacterium]
MLAWAALGRPLWSQVKLHLAFYTPPIAMVGLISTLVELAAPNASNRVALALLASACVAALLVWIKAVAVPLVTKGQLPDGRYLADVLARQRVLRQRRRDHRQALRRRRDSPSYPGPHAHRLSQQTQDPPPDPRSTSRAGLSGPNETRRRPAT